MNESNDTIRRQDAIKEIARWIGYLDEDMILRIQTGLKKLPSVQPEPKTGKWYIDSEGDMRCTACKKKCLRDDIGINILSNYCPSCGVKMYPKEERLL